MPELQEDLPSMPPHQLVSRTKNGKVVYKYADPDNCHCVYVGGGKEYSEYGRLKGERQFVPRRLGQRRGDARERAVASQAAGRTQRAAAIRTYSFK